MSGRAFCNKRYDWHDAFLSSAGMDLNLEKRSVRLKAFQRKARIESISLVGFLQLNDLYNRMDPGPTAIVRSNPAHSGLLNLAHPITHTL